MMKKMQKEWCCRVDFHLRKNAPVRKTDGSGIFPPVCVAFSRNDDTRIPDLSDCRILIQWAICESRHFYPFRIW